VITSKEAAERMGVTISRIQALLRQRRIRGARLVGRTWLIPENFEVKAGTRGPMLRKQKAKRNAK
jgi:excisionase family DNA binding protein